MDLFLIGRQPEVTKYGLVLKKTDTPPFPIIQEICLREPSGQYFVKLELNLTSS